MRDLERDVTSGTKLNSVAFIPARAGSKRIAHKNIKALNGHPLLAYSICAARQSGVFDAVVLCTDSAVYADIGRHYGAEVPFLRDEDISTATSPDIEWVEEALNWLSVAGRSYDVFSILRPTSPFRKPETIRRAWSQFISEGAAIDSLRAVEKCSQHPGKMWVLRGGRMLPLLPLGPEGQPYHSAQYAALPTVYIQNASLEIAWSRVVADGRTIAGNVLIPFLTEGDEGLDINNPEDWWYAEYILANSEARLPEIDRLPFDLSGLF